MKKFNLSKYEKLKKKDDFKKVFENGKFIKTGSYNCLYVATELEMSRIGIVVKKSNVGNSVKRNYEKRLIREFYRCNKNILHKSYDILIFVKKTNTLKSSFLNLNDVYSRKCEDFISILGRINENFK